MTEAQFHQGTASPMANSGDIHTACEKQQCDRASSASTPGAVLGKSPEKLLATTSISATITRTAAVSRSASQALLKARMRSASSPIAHRPDDGIAARSRSARCIWREYASTVQWADKSLRRADPTARSSAELKHLTDRNRHFRYRHGSPRIPALQASVADTVLAPRSMRELCGSFYVSVWSETL